MLYTLQNIEDVWKKSVFSPPTPQQRNFKKNIALTWSPGKRSFVLVHCVQLVFQRFSPFAPLKDLAVRQKQDTKGCWSEILTVGALMVQHDVLWIET